MDWPRKGFDGIGGEDCAGTLGGAAHKPAALHRRELVDRLRSAAEANDIVILTGRTAVSSRRCPTVTSPRKAICGNTCCTVHAASIALRELECSRVIFRQLVSLRDRRQSGLPALPDGAGAPRGRP